MPIASTEPSSSSSVSRIHHSLVSHSTTVCEWLVEKLDITHSNVRDLISLGAIYVDKKRIEEDRVLSSGEYIRAHIEPRRFVSDGIDWKTRIIMERENFIAVDKPSGIPVHATLDNARENVYALIQEQIRQPLFITHRLDCLTSGILVLGKTAQFQADFNKALRKRLVEKHYRAIVEYPPRLGLHLAYQDPSPVVPRHFSFQRYPGWLPCVLEVNSVRVMDDLFELKIRLVTGRTHQIRGQLALLGCPVLGDLEYGGRENATFGLRATRLEFFLDRSQFRISCLDLPWQR